MDDKEFFEAQITHRGYMIGKETRYYILTYKVRDQEYIVKVLDRDNEVGIETVHNRLDYAKREGVRILLSYDIYIEHDDITIVHFKRDRPSGQPWQKDSKQVVSYLMQEYKTLYGETRTKQRQGESNLKQPKNIILYGPPGTGKTYSVIEKALEIIVPQQCQQIKAERNQVVALYKELVEQNRIAFCTFHQSFAYEDFVEGIRTDENGNFTLQEGIFQQLCKAASLDKTEKISVYDFDENAVEFYKMSLGNANEDDEVYSFCIDNNSIALGWGGAVDYSDCKNRDEVKRKFDKYSQDSRKFNVDAIDRFKNWIKAGDIVIVSHGNHRVRAVAKVVGDYYYKEDSDIEYRHFRNVEWLYNGDVIDVRQILKEKVLSQQAIYQFDKQDLNIKQIKRLLAPITSNTEETNNYVLIIDEINRGNVSKIFGELITLIEQDKRIGEQNEVKVSLPYSKQQFGVPNNIYIIGTMNTADRSISLIDTALRRRFQFIELLPQLDLLPIDIDGVNVQSLLGKMNERITFLLDRDHTIGHAYFMQNDMTSNDLIKIMQYKVIPLLQEYFYEDWKKIELVLGGASEVNDSSYLITKRPIDPQRLFNNRLSQDYQRQYQYDVVKNPNKQALIRIYEEIS